MAAHKLIREYVRQQLIAEFKEAGSGSQADFARFSQVDPGLLSAALKGRKQVSPAIIAGWQRRHGVSDARLAELAGVPRPYQWTPQLPAPRATDSQPVASTHDDSLTSALAICHGRWMPSTRERLLQIARQLTRQWPVSRWLALGETIDEDLRGKSFRPDDGSYEEPEESDAPTPPKRTGRAR